MVASPGRRGLRRPAGARPSRSMVSPLDAARRACQWLREARAEYRDAMAEIDRMRERRDAENFRARMGGLPRDELDAELDRRAR